jgi:hypothetical protein
MKIHLDIIVEEAISAIRGEHANPEVAIQAFVNNTVKRT